jgi:hypothetical protein
MDRNWKETVLADAAGELQSSGSYISPEIHLTQNCNTKVIVPKEEWSRTATVLACLESIYR